MTVVHEARMRILYRDVDQMGIVYHPRYFELFELGRTEFVRSEGFSYRDMEEEMGLMLPVVTGQAHYHSPLRFDDEALVRTRVAAWSKTTIRYAYEVLANDDPTVRVTGEVELACVRKADLKPAKFPDELLEVFQRVAPEAYGRKRS
jgi:acyl-CoA thioester hydrolase